MKHPSEAQLALHAGNDLGVLAGWRVRRHLAKCERCRDEVAAFAAAREISSDLAEVPEIPWGRLAGEMKANIRLGLAAGECVRLPAREETPLFRGTRATVALASALVLLVSGLVLERPVPDAKAAADRQGVVLQSTVDGIQVREGDQALRVMHRSVHDRDITYTVSAQGSMEARYVDSRTGNVTINNVYAE